MHVPDGFMNVTMSAATGVISFGTLWAYIRSAKDLIADKFIALTGMMSALIFVLQMINFPIAAGTSGHLLGGALAVIVLGPRLGLICLSVVVIIQSLLFADGGLSALGVNVLNMAIVTSATSWFIVKYWIKFIGKNKTSIVSVSVLAGILSVVFSSIAFTIQYAIGGTISIPGGTVLLAMVTTHFIIGFGEGVITALIITLLIRVRPDLIYAYERSDENTTLKIPASTLTETIEVLFFPMNFIQFLTINQLVALVTIAMFKTFTPNALRPPSAKRRD